MNVTLASTTTVNSLTFNTFSGEYRLGSSTITLLDGITMNAGAGIADIQSPVTIGGVQTWNNESSSDLKVTGLISGSGGITKTGSGLLLIGKEGVPNTFTGPTTISGGYLRYYNNPNLIGSGNLTINGGVLENYWDQQIAARALGSGSGQLQIPGGESGFSASGYSQTVPISNAQVVWGSSFFAPSVLVLGSVNQVANKTTTLNKGIDLNGSTRTIACHSVNAGAAGVISGAVVNNTGTAGLIKEGVGTLTLSGANTYNGGTTVNAGTLGMSNASALGSTSGSLTVNTGGILNLNNQNLTVGNLTGTGGAITNSTAGTKTLTIGQGDATGGNFQGAIVVGTGDIALTKTGSGTLTLSGANTYTGATAVNNGTLQVNGSLTSAVTISSGATLAGTGTITGNVGVPSGATLQPGSPDGTLTITGDATVGGTLAITLDGNGNAVDVSGELDITGGSLEVTGTTSSAIRVIATYGTLTGDFGSNLTLPSGWVVNYTYEGNKIALTGPSGTIFRFR